MNIPQEYKSLPQSGQKGRRLLLRLRERSIWLRKRIEERKLNYLRVDLDREELEAIEWLISKVIILEQDHEDILPSKSIRLEKWNFESRVSIPDELPLSGELGAKRLRRIMRRAKYLQEKIRSAGMADVKERMQRSKAELSALLRLSQHVINLENAISSSPQRAS